MKHVIVVKRGGLIRTLYTEKVNLHALGILQVERASNVEYDNEKQGWTVTLANGVEIPVVFKSRALALESEVNYLQARL
jgi:hypothetical protein